jgi:hypothetical protein
MKKIFVAVAVLGSPLFAYAQSLTGVQTLVNQFAGIVNTLIPVMLGLAVLVFFWGLVKYIASASDEAAKEGGKTLMIWGMVAIFVMVALWSILGYVQSTLGITGGVVNSTPPTFVIPGAS